MLKNVSTNEVNAFVRQVELVERIGETSAENIAALVDDLGACTPGPFEERVNAVAIEPVAASEPRRLIMDPAGFFVVYPDAVRLRLVLEHYTNAGVLDCVLHGGTPAAHGEGSGPEVRAADQAAASARGETVSAARSFPSKAKAAERGAK